MSADEFVAAGKSFDPGVSSGLNLIVELGRLNVLLRHAFPASTRRINICGEIHYDVSCN